MNRLYSPWPQNRILFICPAKSHNYRLRVTFWSFRDGAQGKLCQIKESLSPLKRLDKINPTCVLCVSSWVFHMHDPTAAGVFAGCTFLCTYKFKFSPRFCWFHLFTSAEPCPGNLLLPGHLIHLCRVGYALAFMVSSFPLNKSHAPVPLVSPSQRCCGMSHRAPGRRKGRLPASVWSTAFCWFPFFGAEIHRCISVPLN